MRVRTEAEGANSGTTGWNLEERNPVVRQSAVAWASDPVAKPDGPSAFGVRHIPEYHDQIAG